MHASDTFCPDEIALPLHSEGDANASPFCAEFCSRLARPACSALMFAGVAGGVQEHPSKHSACLHLEDGKCRLEFMYGLSDFWMFTNLVLPSPEQMISSRHMLCRFSLTGFRFGFSLRWHDTTPLVEF